MPFQRILVPVDGSAPSLRGLDKAAELARVLQARIFLLNVTEPQPLTVTPEALAYSPQLIDELHQAGRDILADAAVRVQALGVDCERSQCDALGPGVPAAIVAEAARVNADLIVMGTHGRSGLRRALLGSAAESIVREATIPVMLVHAPEAAAKTV
jgi:nucleotide-binding universal stress UspA family protein